MFDPPHYSYGSLKWGNKVEYRRAFSGVCFLFVCFCLGIYYYSLYGPRVARNVCKTYQAGLGTFPDIENLIPSTVKTQLVRSISDHPDSTPLFPTREQKTPTPYLHPSPRPIQKDARRISVQGHAIISLGSFI